MSHTAVPSAARSLEDASADSDVARLLISCADRPGIVAAVSRFIGDRGANIVQSDQYSTDPEGGRFFMRVVFHRSGLAQRLPILREDFQREVAQPFDMDFTLTDAARPKRVAIMVSRYDHCLLDLLWRARRNELPANVGAVVSNWEDLADEVSAFGIPYHHVPVSKATKADAEASQLELLGHGQYDLVVMARYMQILSDEFLQRVGCPVINIHHSFLPAFAGAGPYERARERGVKLIGATAHYATADLDEGPIIEQDVVRVSHRDSTEELIRQGADIERVVLARAVKWHCEDRIAVNGNTTVVL